MVGAQHRLVDFRRSPEIVGVDDDLRSPFASVIAMSHLQFAGKSARSAWSVAPQ